MSKNSWVSLSIRVSAALACGVLALLLACSPASNQDPQVLPDPPVQDPPVQNPPAQFVSGAFNVALASRVKATTSAIVDSGETSTNVLGMGLNVDTLAIITGVQLEVWLVNSTHVNADGSPKDQAAGQPYAIKWDAYAPSAATTSLSGAAATGSVEFLASASGKASRTKVTVGDTLLANSAGVVVVALVYANGTAAPDMGLGKSAGKVAEYRLSLTPLAPTTFSFAGAKLSAIGVMDLTFLNLAAFSHFTIPSEAAVTADLPHSSGTATFGLQSSTGGGGTGKDPVSYVIFPLSGLAADRGVRLVNIAGAAQSAADKIAATNVGVDPANNSTSSLARDVSTDTVLVNFLVATGETGRVTLNYQDRYGVKGSLIVKLDPEA